jgi:hypothetical protein
MVGSRRIWLKGWASALRVYLGAMAIGNLAWEILHLPLYTIWTSGTAGERAFAVVHCTGGDVLIALTAIGAAWLLFGDRDWPRKRFLAVALAAMLLGIAYTGFSEWLNASVRRSWAYSDWMPVVPLAGGIGLSPLLQWVVVPAGAFWMVRLWERRVGTSP